MIITDREIEKSLKFKEKGFFEALFPYQPLFEVSCNTVCDMNRAHVHCVYYITAFRSCNLLGHFLNQLWLRNCKFYKLLIAMVEYI